MGRIVNHKGILKAGFIHPRAAVRVEFAKPEFSRVFVIEQVEPRQGQGARVAGIQEDQFLSFFGETE